MKPGNRPIRYGANLQEGDFILLIIRGALKSRPILNRSRPFSCLENKSRGIEYRKKRRISAIAGEACECSF